MQPSPSRAVPCRACLFLVLALAGAGCAKLRSERKLDTAPFFENTHAMVGEIQRYNRPPHWVHLHAYRDRESVLVVLETAREIRRLLQSLCLYSTQVVVLHESRTAERQRVVELARYIDEVARPALLSGKSLEIGITAQHFAEILARIRAQETLRQALGAAQPLVTAISSYGYALLDRAEAEVAQATKEVDAEIYAQFAPLFANIRGLDRLQMRWVQDFEHLYEARLGDEAALAELSGNPDLARALPTGSSVEPGALDAAEGRIAEQLARIKVVREHLAPEFEAFEEHQKELEALRVRTDDMLRLARLTLSVWAASHRKLAAGIEVPPQLDLYELLNRAARLGKDLM